MSKNAKNVNFAGPFKTLCKILFTLDKIFALKKFSNDEITNIINLPTKEMP